MYYNLSVTAKSVILNDDNIIFQIDILSKKHPII